MKETKFTKFPLAPFLLGALAEIGFYEPTEIQERIIPKALTGKSIVGQSQTGTGKTHAFLLPILTKIDPEVNEVQAVITAPTRELANQIYHEVLKLTKNAEVELLTKLFVGGTDKNRTIEKLKTQPHIVVGTPGRIYDLVKEKALSIYTAKMMVVDEADMMLDMGFIEDVDKIAASLPGDLQMYVFSATIPENLKPFLKKYMENPLFVQVEPDQKSAKNIEHILIPQRHRNKVDLLINVLQAYNPYLAICFTNTKQNADSLANKLAEKGVKVGIIHGDLPPRERKKMMNQIRNLEFQYIVATDLASRGIDIDGVSHVIHYELPKDLSFYIHRAGRTGRGDYSGISAVIYEENDIMTISKLEKMGITFSNKDLVNGEWVDVQDRNERKNRKKKLPDSKERPIQVKKPNKVKPGYKKKIKNEIETMKKRQRRKGK
ncbi:DEAD/DEAH box helicase [Caldibacillus lycopersici]|uniref:DEAD-box ATP-dependent RNA helicase CshB n=1 Tax=Perspicuibacillus lycopersici TaxID=1325689 RepID=A0AAE3ISN3_9BACI|nr:DEAD/DEAH box helicase [Perspicuibacillus lycopersici]MCU9613898.1 DEAD/DEAH box helicase [Perspicuibacillus lycopersici]